MYLVNKNFYYFIIFNSLDAWLEKLGVTIRTGLLQENSLVRHS